MIAIVGGGLAGLSAAYHLHTDYKVFEREPKVGGLCRSMYINDYIFDYAPHILFTRDPYTRRLFQNILGENILSHMRRAYIYLNGTYVKYPFEANLYPLPEKMKEECIQGVIDKPVLKPKNFYDWIQTTMGPGIAKHYMVPYNEKIWKYPLEFMNVEWIAGRVPSPSINEMRKGAESPQPREYGPNTEFWYPKHGGIGALADNLAKNIKVELESEVMGFNSSQSGIEVRYNERGNEKTFESDKVLSSIPLPEIITLMEDVPKEVQEATDRLVYNSLICVMIGVNRIKISDKHWLYFPEKDLIFNRISFPMNFSPYTTPKGRSSILIEVTFRNLEISLEKAKERVLQDLIKVNLVTEDDEIELCEAKDFKYAYVIYDLDHRKNVKIIHNYLVEHNIIPIGRFGEWEYYNMDKAIQSGKNAAGKIKE
jgi:UDP-galactopyranose mutase